jgi:hypothetical protein
MHARVGDRAGDGAPAHRRRRRVFTWLRVSRRAPPRAASDSTPIPTQARGRTRVGRPRQRVRRRVSHRIPRWMAAHRPHRGPALHAVGSAVRPPGHRRQGAVHPGAGGAYGWIPTVGSGPQAAGPLDRGLSVGAAGLRGRGGGAANRPPRRRAGAGWPPSASRRPARAIQFRFDWPINWWGIPSMPVPSR